MLEASASHDSIYSTYLEYLCAFIKLLDVVFDYTPSVKRNKKTIVSLWQHAFSLTRECFPLLLVGRIILSTEREKMETKERRKDP